eukprot:491234-Amorphochlora_amoeboformis.AAC.1
MCTRIYNLYCPNILSQHPEKKQKLKGEAKKVESKTKTDKNATKQATSSPKVLTQIRSIDASLHPTNQIAKD